uniref:Plasmodium vivax Vir protein n=1 Tax=Strongyloides papillosus TaxID=174720 RepID=A0A0N5BDY2_STREA
MKAYFIHLIYLYIIFLYSFVKCSTDHLKNAKSECYCPCLTTESTSIQTTVDDDKLFTTDDNYLSTLYINKQESTETSFVPTQKETEKIDENISTEIIVEDKEKTTTIDDIIVVVNENKTSTQPVVEETTNKETTDKLTSEVETSTHYKYETTEEDSYLSINGNETFLITDEGELLTTTKNEQSTEDINSQTTPIIKQTTDYPTTTKSGNSSTNKEENQAKSEELKIETRNPRIRNSQNQTSTKVPLVIKEERGIIFRIYIFIHHIKETLVSKFFY